MTFQRTPHPGRREPSSSKYKLSSSSDPSRLVLAMVETSTSSINPKIATQFALEATTILQKECEPKEELKPRRKQALFTLVIISGPPFQLMNQQEGGERK